MARVQDLRLRRGTAAQWVTANPILNAGEPGYETDTHLLRIGDGATAFTSLDAFPIDSSSPRGAVKAFRAPAAPAATAIGATETTIYTAAQIGTVAIVSGRRYRFTVRGIMSMGTIQTGSQGSLRVRLTSISGAILMNVTVSAAGTGLQGFTNVVEMLGGTDIAAGSQTFVITNFGTASSAATIAYSAGQLYTNLGLLIEDIGT